MIARFLKARMPRSLYARAVLILLVPVITILIVVSVVFIQRLYDNVTRQMTEAVSLELRLVLNRIEEAPDAGGALQAALEVALPLAIAIDADGAEVTDRFGWFDLSGRVIAETLRDELPEVRAVDLASSEGSVLISTVTPQGELALEVPRRRFSARNPHQFLVLIGFTALLMTAIALIYLRNQVRPIRRLARAADAFGKGRVVPYRPTGASEIRQAGTAFLDMRDRLERQIEQRTQMLSGVSHDLRTPLTRMKLALSLMDETDETRDIGRDLTDMEKMLDAFLDFARGETGEEPARMDPGEVARAAVERARRGQQPVQLGEIAEGSEAMLRPDAMGRALDNLIGNAVRYGGEARVAVVVEGGEAVFQVDDPGPGIPEALRLEAQKPFSRLDSARNQDGGSGVGLGLTIAAEIARAHGGALRLKTSPDLKGLRAEIAIPL